MEYSEIDAMNPSTLVHGLRSMRHLKRVIDSGGIEETDAMRLGTGIHALTLEPEEFAKRFVIVPDFHLDEENVSGTGTNRRQSQSKATNYVKAKLSEFAKANEGKKFISGSQYQNALNAIKALRERKHISDIIDRCQKEVVLQGVICGMQCKGRVDLLDIPNGLIVDLKTTTNCEMYAFGRTFANLNIGFKMAMYRELAQQQFKRRFRCAIICQETAGDFDNAYCSIADQILDNAIDKVKDVAQRWQLCQHDGVYPGVDGGAIDYPIFVPNWAMGDDDNLVWAESSVEEVEGAYF